ncbi:Hypp3134 [Branchiostoma lanceolatum]|uniref:Hypp3134 protein n=1 Tax=Branchiostoma lanceolatum TaxID=7740 RepID=A0A8K0A0A1_BRALA|nr:Hypp3134 [Branchiostoma lanceolatum]
MVSMYLSVDYCVQEDQRWQETLLKCSSNNTLVTALLKNDELRPWVRQYWARRKDWIKSPLPLCEELPKTLTHFVAYCVMEGTEEGYMRAHNINNYADFFSPLLKAVRMMFKDTFCTTKTAVAATLIIEGRIPPARKFTTADSSALADLFPYLRCLEKLHIMKSWMSASATRKIIDRLCELKHLKDLDLFSNTIDDEGVVKLTQIFVQLKNLKKLSMEANGITPAGVAIIARNIAKLQELEKFIIGNEVASSILNMTKTFLTMPKLRKAVLSALHTKPAEIPEVEKQVREVVELLQAKVYSVRPWKVKLFYDAANSDRNATMDSGWAMVRSELRKDLGGGAVVVESGNRELNIVLWVTCWGC